jgi:hypothetical protein
MKRWLAIVVCFAFLAVSAALAQPPNDPATKEDVQKLLELQNSRKTFDSVLDVYKQQIPVQIKSIIAERMPNATPEESARLNAFVSNALDKMLKNAPYDELMQAMIPICQRHYTHEEVQEVIRFYSSTVGKKMLAEQPAVMAEYTQAMQPIIQKWTKSQVADLKASVEQFAKETRLKKTLHEAPAQPAKPIPASLLEPMQR